MAARGSLIIIFPEQILSVNTSSISSTSSVTTSGQSITTNTEDGQTYSVACTLADGYKIASANFSPSTNGGSIGSFTDSAINMMAGAGGIDGTLTITAAQSTTVKAVSSDNLAEFKAKCDETYVKIGEIGSGVVDLGTFNVGENTISTELSQAALSDDCKFVKVTASETEQEMILAKSMCIPSIQTALFEYVVVDDKNNAYQTYLQIVGTTAIIAENNLHAPRIKTPLANETYKLVGVPSDYLESGFDLFRTSEIATSGQTTPSSDLIVGGLFFTDV